MARFRAFASDDSSSSSEDEPDNRSISEKPQYHEEDESEPEEEPEEESEEEEESSPESSSSEMLEDELVQARRRPRTALVEDENGDVQLTGDDDEELDLHDESSSSSSSSSPKSEPRAIGPAPNIIPWARHVGVDAQKMHVMQTSLFRMPEEAAALKSLNQQPARQKTVSALNLPLPHQGVNRKHSRDSDGDGLRHDSRERASFAHDIGPAVFRPSRKYARVEIISSISNGKDGDYADAGLAFGRSFRVGWGPGGALVHVGAICSPFSSSHSANSSVVKITKTLFPPVKIQSTSESAEDISPPSIASKLLQHHLSHTLIKREDPDCPFAQPQASSTGAPFSRPNSSPLNFASFASLFPTTDNAGPASLFRLGDTLFDPIDLHLNGRKQGPTLLPGATIITPDVRNRITILRRRRALSKWLESVVKPLVDSDIRLKASNGTIVGSYSPADTVFSQLTGHQVSQACTTAMDSGYLKLATLVSQAGGDDTFKADIRSQLEVWTTENLAPTSAGTGVGSGPNGLIGRGVWRVYRVLSGPPLYDPSNASQLGSWVDDVCAGLEWKRIFGLCLWYGTGIDASVADAVRLYEGLVQRYSPGTIARPIASWVIDRRGSQSTPPAPAPSFNLGSSRAGANFFTSTATPAQGSLQKSEDPLYSLIRLYSDPALSLAQALDPLSFGPDERWGGIGACWHLYIILSRVMRIRDFSDRGDVKTTKRGSRAKVNGAVNGHTGPVGETSEEEDLDNGDFVDGHSPTADLLTSSYAFELESWGMVQEAAFVLLHIEGNVGREKAIKDLLARSAPQMDDWMTRGLVGSLKIPMSWVNGAKAMYAYDQGNFFNAYELYLSAQLYNLAHDLAVLELAPDAILRRDLELLKDLFEPFDLDGRRDKIDGWFVRGKVFLEYVNIMTRLPQLQEQAQAERDEQGGDTTVPDAVQAEELDDLTRRVPKLIALLPDVLHRSRLIDDRHAAALEEMTQGLLSAMGKAKPSMLIKQPILNFMDGATKISLIRGKGYARFLNKVGA